MNFSLFPCRVGLFIQITGVFALLFSLPTCKPVEQELKVKVETSAVTDVGHSFAIIEGKVVDVGDGKIDQHGFCYSLSENPTIVNTNTQLGARTTAGSFSDSLLNLQSGTTYYVRAYAIASDEIYYGDQTSFTTLTPTSPVVAIDSVGEFENDSVKVVSTVTDDGGSEVTARGVCWGLNQNPTLSDAFTNVGSGTGSFTSYITGLAPDTTYYFRAYATSSAATSYSDQQQVSTPPGSVSISTEAITGITMNSAVSGGTITNDGGSEITVRGVCWSAAENPSISDSKTTDGAGIGSFTSSISGLSPGTTYYVRAYASNNSGTFYGSELSFSTTSQSASLPVLTTSAVSSITENSAVSGGNITDDGGTSVTARGVCWSTSHNPDLSHGFTVDETGTGLFTSSITGLSPNTTYYVRAYATNSEGTSYGSEEGFTTDQAVFLPTLTTAPVTSITETSAVNGGNITDDGGAEVTARGVCWSTSENPDISGDHTSDGTGTGSFTSSITGLNPQTTYYVRAYATNEVGTSYGNEVSFTTSQSGTLASLTTAFATGITDNSAESGGNVSNDGESAVIARGVCWSIMHDPDLSGIYTTDGAGLGSFTSSITGLSPNTTYYARAYATNGIGTAFGNEIAFTTNSPPTLASISTIAASEITVNTAKSGGNISDDGGSEIIARGVCRSVSHNPDLSDDHTTDGMGIGDFTSFLTGLSANTTYYVRAYATNGLGTEYGDEITFSTWAETVTDYDGNVYPAIQIGEQIWMAENLKVTHYSDGSSVPLVENGNDWQDLGLNLDKGFCWYDNSISNGNIYGALYTWSAAMNGAESKNTNPSGVQGVCPIGYHLPSDLEWMEFEMYLGLSQTEAGNTGYRGTDEGGKLKETGNQHWNSPNSGATNSTGFTALPGGERAGDGAFISINNYAVFWTASDFMVAWATSRGLSQSSAGIARSATGYNLGLSVRCVKD